MFATVIRAVISAPVEQVLTPTEPVSSTRPLWLPFLVLGIVAGIAAIGSFFINAKHDK